MNVLPLLCSARNDTTPVCMFNTVHCYTTCIFVSELLMIDKENEVKELVLK